jgi:type VI protein secretion system component VasF
MPAPNERQLETPTSTTATAPPAFRDEKQGIDVSRKWKMVALTLAAILGAILVVGLIVFLGCGWLVLDLLDRSDKS